MAYETLELRGLRSIGAWSGVFFFLRGLWERPEDGDIHVCYGRMMVSHHGREKARGTRTADIPSDSSQYSLQREYVLGSNARRDRESSALNL